MEWAHGTRPGEPGCILTGRDVSERKKLERELRHQAFHDSLTGLANRALFEDRLAHALAALRRRDGGLAVLFIDLDDFKTVNDSLGHSSGDDLLRTVGERLRASLRDADTAARLGGDEFGVLLEGADTVEDATEVAKRLLAALEPPFDLDGRQLNVPASIGIALAGRTRATMEELMRNADLAMYEAKRRGGAQWRVFEESMHTVALGRLELGTELQRAVDEAQFELHFQPIVTLDTADVIGAEALIRWRHPERGLLAPKQFLPLAEQSGLIVPMGRWALADACRTLAEWQETYPQTHPMYLSVNVSMRQLREPGIVQDVRVALAEAGIEPRQLVLEITESFLADETEPVLRCLQRLRAMGVRLAVDDFGTGYSALSYLQRFPIDILKIDRSFVEHARPGSPSLNLVRSIVQLGQSLHLEIVAEGVEEADQAEELLAMGVKSGQGFYYAKPLEAERFAALLLNESRLSLID
jgi:diguanylate cyclase (GGDEF)-like protein